MAKQLADWKLEGNGQTVAVVIPSVAANHCPVGCDDVSPRTDNPVAACVAVVVASTPAFQTETTTTANPNKEQTAVAAVEIGSYVGDPVDG